MRFILYTLVLGALFLAGVALTLVRFVPHTPLARWHVDPLTAPVPRTPNGWRVGPAGTPGADAVAPVYRADAATLARTLDEMAQRQARTERIAGRPDELWMSYVQRSEVLRFPDYIAVRAIALGPDRATLAIFSRARYGYSDLGVNRARVEAWLAALKPLEQ